MKKLFPIQPDLPEGFSYYPDFISIDDEEELIKQVMSTKLHPMIFQGFEAKRKVASFGFDYSFENRTLKKGTEIPETFNQLVGKVAMQAGIKSDQFAELLVTEYPPGAVINWHRDAPPFDLIAGISLLSDCTFRFRPHDKTKQGRKSIISLPVTRRSLYFIDGIARTEWQHSILPVKETRYSITLRTLKK